MIVSSLPILAVDLFGSIQMIVLSFLCLHLAAELKRREPNNVIWTYLLWVCLALAVFAISRSAGHILKQILLLSGQKSAWDSLRPFSGAINTFTFMVVASVTLFFERIWNIYQQILKDQQALQAAHEKVLYLNQNLESLVLERTVELALSEHKYRRIFEVSRDMILVSATDGSIVDLNPAGFTMLGFDHAKSSPKSKKVQEFLADEAAWRNLYAEICKQGYVLNAEIDLKRMDGSTMRALISASLDRGTPDKMDTIHWLARDIEQRRLMENQIAQADKLASIGQLAAGIAHEINNPLGIILGYTQLLLREEIHDSEKYADLKTIERQVRNCKSILEDLLNFARSSEPKKEMLIIHDAIDDALNFIQHHAELNSVRIVKNYDPQVPPMLLDEKKIRQVLTNLIMNAKHAVGQSGTISLATTFDPEKNRVVISIRDTGHGIDKKNLSRIFDPFFTTKPTGEGTGLGLSVSYGIIKNHGGDIFAESQTGKGTTFKVVLPVASRTVRNI